jgi:hypothetical protein
MKTMPRVSSHRKPFPLPGRVAVFFFLFSLSVSRSFSGPAETGPASAVPVASPDAAAAGPPPAEPAEEADPAVPDDATLEATGAVIREIRIRAADIFDPERPGENNRLFRAANRVHVRTGERVIRRLLLFKPGDPYSRRLLDESERILRRTSYLYDASIRPVRFEDNHVDVEVATRDVWTLKIGGGVSRSGGENDFRIGVKDSNFLGTGTELGLQRESDVDRTSNTYRFRDPNLQGTRLRLELEYSDNTDGRGRRFRLGRPFYALDSRWSAEGRVRSEDRVERLYDRGEVSEEFRHESEAYTGSWGFSRGYVGRSARRWLVGVTWERDRYAAIPGGTLRELPGERVLSYPWLGFQWIRDRFIEARDLDRIARTEDLNLGQEFQGFVGWSPRSLGADRDRAVFGAAYQIGGSPGAGQILLAELRGSGRVAGGRGEDVRLGGAVRYYVRDLGRHALYALVEADAVRRLDPEGQLLVGGDSGLRGYPLRYLSGDRRVLFTLEQRFYTRWHLLRLMHVGGAVFFDAGRAWFHGEAQADGTIYKDVGFGLRMGSSRSSSAAMVHLDVAFALDGDESIDDVQFLVTTRETF